jgi:hypothetical protein
MFESVQLHQDRYINSFNKSMELVAPKAKMDESPTILSMTKRVL